MTQQRDTYLNGLNALIELFIQNTALVFFERIAFLIKQRCLELAYKVDLNQVSMIYIQEADYYYYPEVCPK